jgi:hypothetical protein
LYNIFGGYGSKIFRIMAIDKPELGLAEGARRFRQARQKGVEQMLTGFALSADLFLLIQYSNFNPNGAFVI